MTVFVVMGNDFPDCVFADEAEAEKYVAVKKPENNRIYWRVYKFELKGTP